MLSQNRLSPCQHSHRVVDRQYHHLDIEVSIVQLDQPRLDTTDVETHTLIETSRYKAL